MSNQPPVRLTLYEEKLREGLLAFQLPAEQAEFTGLPEETIDGALQDEGKVPVVIMAGEKPVGFFILHTGADIADFYHHWSEALLLRAFLVDYASQGQGFAKAAMALLPGFVRIHFPAVREVVLAVNERNLPAGNLYLRAGFRDYGLRRSGAKGSQMILQYSLEEFSAGSGGDMDNGDGCKSG
ncbi:GNAT family protein [Paenibacillus sp. FSL L8-0436]|uniref:GNAT family N-acetyltransferase n=1 Tax=Paenibacillus sp. FSL L8-0436 TaxID=2954686 RepID=UPI0031583436